MSRSTPDVVNNYFALDAGHDPDGLVALFADDAVVVDEGQTMEGHDAIRDWRVEGSAAKYSYTTEVSRIEEVEPDRWVATVRLTGNFPGGIADVRYTFRLSDGRITRLVIAP